ncbi:MAG: aminoacyl-histidine dipeptidase [Prevotellaceae bacterium]|jgi:dipeptidase D|nr:aminoacyl-histidine dipeptidase [Prevotellaceae bacterium]
MNIQDLEPRIVFKFFKEILSIPRPSKKEGKIIKYLLDFAKEHNLQAKTDKAGNVLICKSATKGKENLPTVVLQSHVDMVCEKNSDVVFDFENDAIQAYVDGNWIKAKGTTLGADCGIGMAAELAILASNDIEHGNLECLFTVDEETGLTGASELEPNFFTGKILLNLDSEDEGEIFIGCAGGRDTVGKIAYSEVAAPEKGIAFRVDVKGLKGGHSGDDINKGLACANKALNRLLYPFLDYIEISKFDGGNLRNAIAREAYAIVVVSPDKVDAFKKHVSKFEEDLRNEYRRTEPDMVIGISETEKPETVIDGKTKFSLMNCLYACPHGVLAMSREIPNLVETSTNLASVKMDGKYITIATSQRSAVNSSKDDASACVVACFRLVDAEVWQGDGYPGWIPNPNSPVLAVAESVYEKTFGKKPLVKAIHAGLECGLFLEKYPELDMISFGPTLRGVHSPDERLDIASTQKFWLLLINILKEIK